MNSARRIVIFLIFVVACILLLSLIFGGVKKSSNGGTVVKDFNLKEYITRDSKVIAITDGRIVGDDAHRAIRITVDRNSRKMEVIQGYEGKVIESKTYDNNQKAYQEFISALAKTGFGKKRKGNFVSEDGVCATGKRYVFEVIDNNESVSRTWAANCAKGSSSAKPELVANLFKQQITDYNKITSGLTL